jgi:integrase/recombinase XerD
VSTPPLSALLTGFFLRYLVTERNVSRHTIAAYRDGLKLLLQFTATRCRRQIEQLTLDDFSASTVLDFLNDLEVTRHNTPRTRNARLAALQTFFRYVVTHEPALASQCDPILALSSKKAIHPVLGYLTEQELGHVLAHVDRANPNGERDYVFLAVLYDTGTRIQELLDLTPQDFHLDPPAFVRVRGKGRRERLCPLLPQTARLVRRFLTAQHRPLDDKQPLLQNRRGLRLTRHGGRYLLRKYVDRAARSMPSLARRGISPHTVRHTKAMHLLQSGVPLISVKDFLGHVDVKSTEIYVQSDLEMKRAALATTDSPATVSPRGSRLPSSLIAWLESL